PQPPATGTRAGPRLLRPDGRPHPRLRSSVRSTDLCAADEPPLGGAGGSPDPTASTDAQRGRVPDGAVRAPRRRRDVAIQLGLDPQSAAAAARRSAPGSRLLATGAGVPAAESRVLRGPAAIFLTPFVSLDRRPG